MVKSNVRLQDNFADSGNGNIKYYEKLSWVILKLFKCYSVFAALQTHFSGISISTFICHFYFLLCFCQKRSNKNLQDSLKFYVILQENNILLKYAAYLQFTWYIYEYLEFCILFQKCIYIQKYFRKT